MKVLADVYVSNRVLPSLNLKGKVKPARTHISIGRKSTAKDGAVYLMLSTMQNRNGVFYKIRGNVLHVHQKFVTEGKATICMIDPQHDIVISKADVSQLKNILRLVAATAQGKEAGQLNGADAATDVDSTSKVENGRCLLPVLIPPSSKQIGNLKTKLVITSQQDYPMTHDFPRSLEELQVSFCKLKRLDSRIPGLRSLTALNLSHNGICDVSPELSQLTCLRTLDLSFNNICELPEALFTKVHAADDGLTSLNVVDISSNKLRTLPASFCRLVRLVALRLANNQLASLPAGFGRLRALRTLDLSHNKLRILPASFKRLSLDSLDLFENVFVSVAANGTKLLRTFNDHVVSLRELAARAAVRHRLQYGSDDLPRSLIHYLTEAKPCTSCSGPCFESHAACILSVSVRSLVSGTSTALDAAGRDDVPLQAVACSPVCFKKVFKE